MNKEQFKKLTRGTPVLIARVDAEDSDYNHLKKYIGNIYPIKRINIHEESIAVSDKNSGEQLFYMNEIEILETAKNEIKHPEPVTFDVNMLV